MNGFKFSATQIFSPSQMQRGAMPDHVARIIVHPLPLPTLGRHVCRQSALCVIEIVCRAYSIVGEESDYHKMKLPARNRMISAYLNVAEFLSSMIKIVDIDTPFDSLLAVISCRVYVMVYTRYSIWKFQKIVVQSGLYFITRDFCLTF